MKVAGFVFLPFLLLLFSCEDNATTSNDETKSTINILNLSPETQSIVTSQDTIKALLEYSIGKDVTSEFGFLIAILFVSTTEGKTFSVGPNNQIELVDRDGEVTLEYPLESIWNNIELKHPITCYFYLEKITAETPLGRSSVVIAKTEAINYME